ncbi:hypothetical protein [Alcaligenes sp. Marseille-Q7550]
MSAARLRWFIFLPALLPAAAWPQAGRTCSLPPTAPSCAPAAELAGEPEPAPDLGLLNPVDLLTDASSKATPTCLRAGPGHCCNCNGT